MGFWNPSRSPSPSRSRTHSHSTSKHYASRPSYARSASSFFSSLSGAGGASTSRGRSYNSRARPRDGLVAKMRKFLRDLYTYMKKHPVKVFFLVIMPLITGGALTKILATFGVRLPRSLEQMVSSSAVRGGYGDERYYARGGARDFGGGSALPGMGGGLGESIQGALGIAKMFM